MTPPTANLVAAGVSDVGRVRRSNEDAWMVDTDAGVAIVCDGMGGHRAGEVASRMAVDDVARAWRGPGVRQACAAWLATGTAEARRAVFGAVRRAVLDANAAIVAEAQADRDKHGMGTTFTGLLFCGGEALVAHAGDSRAYLVRARTAVQVTEDHTLVARLAEAGVPVDAAQPTRWKGVVTNSLGSANAAVQVAAVPLVDGDRFVLCSDGVSEYLSAQEIAELLGQHPSPARAAQKLVDRALQRGGHDNATALVVKVLEAGASRSVDVARRDHEALAACALTARMSHARRLRLLRAATEHALVNGQLLAPRVDGEPAAWIVLAGQVTRDGVRVGGGALLHPRALLLDADDGGASAVAEPWVARSAVRALALRAADVAALAVEDRELGELVYGALAGAAQP